MLRPLSIFFVTILAGLVGLIVLPGIFGGPAVIIPVLAAAGFGYFGLAREVAFGILAATLVLEISVSAPLGLYALPVALAAAVGTFAQRLVQVGLVAKGPEIGLNEVARSSLLTIFASLVILIFSFGVAAGYHLAVSWSGFIKSIFTFRLLAKTILLIWLFWLILFGLERLRVRRREAW